MDVTKEMEITEVLDMLIIMFNMTTKISLPELIDADTTDLIEGMRNFLNALEEGIALLSEEELRLLNDDEL